MEYERFAPLVTPNTKLMARVAAALVGVSDAEDAAQDALVRAWRAWPSLRDPNATRAWLMQITVNVCRSWLRKRGPSGSLDDLPGGQRRPDDALSTGLEQPGPGSGDHIAALDLRRALRALDDDTRMVIALRFYAGMDSTEIGGLLGVSPATIRGRLRRALLALRQALDISDQRDQRTAPSPMTSSLTSRKDA